MAKKIISAFRVSECSNGCEYDLSNSNFTSFKKLAYDIGRAEWGEVIRAIDEDGNTYCARWNRQYCRYDFIRE